MAAPARTTDNESSPAPLFPPAPPSVISSRMTDIASEDGDAIEAAVKKINPATESRPGTATGTSSARGGNWSQSLPLRKGLQRGSLSGSIASGRPLSSASKTSRSHAPLASQAFFRPMSSQKLQAQRAPRPPSLGQHRPSIDDLPDEDDQSHIAPHEVRVPAAMNRSSLPTSDLADVQLPPSRGTETTEIYDHVTSTASPTHGHYPAVSVTDSVSPLYRKQAEEKGLSLNLDKSNSYRNNANALTPIKTPHSFRSSLFMPGMGDSSTNRPNHDMRGAEKLSSGTSSPRPTSNAAEATTKEVNPNPRLGRNHEYFEGNTVFCLGGRFQNTRHRPINIGTGLLIILPAALFFGGSAPYLWHHLSPAVPIIFAYIFIISLSSFIRASVSDPGILPRNLHQFPPADENEDPLRLAPPTNDWTLIKSAEPSIAAMEVPTKFCRSCNIWRPPRAHHCRLCDNCVETQDHHCVWVNNCVGRRNYRYFFTFVTSTMIMGIYLIGVSFAQIGIYSHREGISFGDAVGHSRIALALIIYSIIGLLYPAALTGYHLFLMARGETTREFLNSHKLLKQDRYRAFTQGSMWRNWVVVLCRPRPPTYYRFKDLYEEGDQRFGERRNPQETRRPAATQDVEMHSVRPFQGPVSLRNEVSTPR
ncbi:palmitoyltransferase ERF2 [Xylaria bambusicola]|uniref:palmitoyltransferase ERF2 n=1 Tax=Xylaria bambusicola TaxID=326684 RepID=UPI002007E03B|nr:palmitoyltransferase ERF2 [Xylaria bambusicola]KAI0521162.1 palmitoyltransferase ERF2 [Xylaria bambusicola]